MSHNEKDPDVMETEDAIYHETPAAETRREHKRGPEMSWTRKSPDRNRAEPRLQGVTMRPATSQRQTG